MKEYTYAVRMGHYNTMWKAPIVFVGSKVECERWIKDNLKEPGQAAYIDYIRKEIL